MAGLKVVGLAGSLRKASFNRGLLRIVAEHLPSDVTFEILDYSDFPVFNQDLEVDGAPPANVQAIKDKVAAADAVIFASTEYNFSVSSPLKNAIDWFSRAPNAFNDKPAGIVSAGGGQGGSRSQYHLRQIGVFLNLHFLNGAPVFVNAFAPGVVDFATGDILGETEKTAVKTFVDAFVPWALRIKGTA